jgi:hypothetical protein
MGRGRMDARLLELYTSWRWVALEGRLGVAQNRSERNGEETNLLPYRDSNS